MAGWTPSSPPPRARGPWGYLAWLADRQRGRVARGALLGTAWTVGLAVPPALLARAVDGLADGRRGSVLGWALALLATGAALAGLSIWRHRTMTVVRLDAALRTVTEVNAHPVRLGAALTRSRAGEVASVGGADAWTIARSLTVTGPGVGAVLAYAVVAVLLQISVPLAAVVLAGVPLLVAVVAPAVRRLQRAGTPYRDRQAVTTARHDAGPGDHAAAVRAALHAAAADDVVRGLPDGLAAPVGPDGRTLSGGQRQRLRLARALRADPEVLLAVEPTSALDAATEAALVERLVHARRGRTTLVTSTSAAVLQGADVVHLLVGGRVVASGRHADLLREVPPYADLVLRGRPPGPALDDRRRDGGAR